jgi:hypothetical protein
LADQTFDLSDQTSDLADHTSDLTLSIRHVTIVTHA